MRAILLGLTLLLAGCATQNTSSDFSQEAPGLPVAQAALAGGMPDMALRLSDDLLAKDPRNLQVLLTKADALMQLGRLDDADAAYSMALAVDARSVPALIGLGRLRLQSDPAHAEILFQGALQGEPRNAVALNDLGIVLDLQGEHVRAQENYRKAIAADPAMRAAEVNLALSLAMTGQAADAVQRLRPLANSPDASRRLRHDLAAAMAMAGDREGAARLLNGDLTQQQIEDALAAYARLGAAPRQVQ